MSLMGWLATFYRPSASGAEEIYHHAIEASEDLRIANLSLQQQLAPFRRLSDPFDAIRRAATLADSFEKPQEAAMYKGNRR